MDTASPSPLHGLAPQAESFRLQCQSWITGIIGHFLLQLFTASFCPFVLVPALSSGFNSFFLPSVYLDPDVFIADSDIPSWLLVC